MRFKILVSFAALFSGICCVIVQAGDVSVQGQNPVRVGDYFGNLEYSSYTDLVSYLKLENSFEAREQEKNQGLDIYEFKEKSTKKAFIYSLILPGAGEFYAGSKLKGALFLGLEGLFWLGYFNYHGDAVDKENAYRNFANLYWNDSLYTVGLQTYYGVDSDYDTVWVDSITYFLFTHHIRLGADSLPIKDRQYYENIGKYDQFSFGWTDFVDTTQLETPLRADYLKQRRKANELFDRAKYAVMLSLANHIVSAFDAALTTRMYNRKGDRFTEIGVKFRLAEDRGDLIPRASLNIKF